MTELATPLVLVAVLAPLVTALAVALAPGPREIERLGRGGALITAAAALTLAVLAIAEAPEVAARTSWYVLDVWGGVFLALVASIGLASALTSPAYLRHAGRSFFSARRSRAWYYASLFVFWAVLLALPLTANLGVAWLLVEGTTATSTLLVAFSGSRSGLEAGWKYVVLTTLGLTIALLGIVFLIAAIGDGSSLAALDWDSLARVAPELDDSIVLVAFVLIVAGLGTKVGWAPVHNWLPDAHSEAPPPVSAMLSAALLPTVLLIAWRTKLALEPALGPQAPQTVLLGFGLLSLAVAVPFLWRSLPPKRLLAYSSLEHMGVLALGIGFATPLAIAGVVVHVAGHGIAKALGFYAAIPLQREDPATSRAPARGVAHTNPSTALSLGVSLGTLAGVPPLPLFISELMILLGGAAAGLLWVSAVAALLLALGFLGLTHALLEGLLAKPRRGVGRRSRSARPAAVLTSIAVVGLLALTAAAFALPGSDLVRGLIGGAA